MVREVEVNNYLNLLYYSRGRKRKSVAFGQAAGGTRGENFLLLDYWSHYEQEKESLLQRDRRTGCS